MDKIKSDSPEYSMPPPIEQVNSVLVQNQFKPVETKMTRVKEIKPKPDLSPDFQIPVPKDQSTYQSDRLKGAVKPTPNVVLPDIQSARTKRVSSKSYKPAVKRIGLFLTISKSYIVIGRLYLGYLPGSRDRLLFVKRPSIF